MCLILDCMSDKLVEISTLLYQFLQTSVFPEIYLYCIDTLQIIFIYHN